MEKNLRWSIFVQCDGQAVRQLVEYGNREPQAVVRLKSKAQFRQLCQNDKTIERCYQRFVSAYEKLDSEFEILHDQFGGYRLVYVGTSPLKAKIVLKTSPVGYLCLFEKIISDLSVVSKVSTGEEFLMLGPVRFINSDCAPNCEYDFTSSDRIVRLRTLKNLSPGTEITVKYGPDFFEKCECMCATCSKENIRNVSAAVAALDGPNLRSRKVPSFYPKVTLLERSLGESSSTASEDSGQVTPKSNNLVADVTRTQEENIEYERLPEVEVAAVHGSSDNSRNIGSSLSSRKRKCLTRVRPKAMFQGFLELVDESSLSSTSDYVDDIESVPYISCPQSVPSECSSPATLIDESFPNSQPPSLHLTELFSDVAPLDFVDTEVGKLDIEVVRPMSRPLYPGSTVGETNANALIEGYCSRFNLTDLAAKGLFSLLRKLLPAGTDLASAHKYIANLKSDYSNEILKKEVSNEGVYSVLRCENQSSKASG